MQINFDLKVHLKQKFVLHSKRKKKKFHLKCLSFFIFFYMVFTWKGGATKYEYTNFISILWPFFHPSSAIWNHTQRLSLFIWQVKTKMALHESFMLLDMTAAFLLTSQIGPNHHLLLETITNNIFSIAHQLSTSGEGILSVLTLISKLATHDITLLPDTALLDVSCLLLGRCNLREQSILLKLCEFIQFTSIKQLDLKRIMLNSVSSFTSHFKM